MAEWISVKEKLPAQHFEVLVCNGHGVVRSGYYSYRKDVKGQYLWAYGRYPKVAYANDITHWMPLPEPPKEPNSLGKPENCEYYTTSCFWGGGGCLGTREIDPCKGKDCKKYKPKMDGGAEG